jgi:hypothetical protein
MKGWWKSNINVWFPFMYSQKWNCCFQNRIIMFCLPVPKLIYLWEIYLQYFQDRSVYSAAGKYVDWSLEYINFSQTHECGNLDWGRGKPRKEIHKCDFPCSVDYSAYCDTSLSPQLSAASVRHRDISSSQGVSWRSTDKESQALIST